MLIKIREIEEQPEGLRSFGVGGLLLSPFAKILAGALLALTLSATGFGAYKAYQFKNMEIKYLETVNELAHSVSELANCHGTVDEQNKEIIDIQIDAAEKVDLVKKVNDQLDSSNKLQEKEIERLKKQTAPLTCEESRDWLKDGITIFGEKE
jgi:septal ring factor EnvC (AmiA/AmiB activator)